MAIVKEHFNAVVAENCMKSGALQPREGQFDFGLADRFVALGEQSGCHMTGHTLVWHSQSPAWFFIDDEGEEVRREVLLRRMENRSDERRVGEACVSTCRSRCSLYH